MISQEKREALLSFMSSYKLEHGYPPTQAEMGKAVGTSQGHVRRCLSVLEREGAVRRLSRWIRAFEVV